LGRSAPGLMINHAATLVRQLVAVYGPRTVEAALADHPFFPLEEGPEREATHGVSPLPFTGTWVQIRMAPHALLYRRGVPAPW